MATATAISGGVGAVGGVMKMVEGRKMQKEAEDKIREFQWQEINNPYDALQVSTMGADLEQEQINRSTATVTEALRSGGTRGMVGGLGKVHSNNIDASRRIGASLDEQQKNIDMSRAGYEGKINDMIENRQSNELAGYGQMMNVGMGMRHDGMANIAGAVNTMGQAGMNMSEIKKNDALTNTYNKMSGGQ